jgi:hypothetical protein
MKQVRIISRTHEGFRRAGIAHSTKPTHYPIDSFTPEQLAALKAEPQLVVDEVEVPDPEPADAPADDDKPEDKPKPKGKKDT